MLKHRAKYIGIAILLHVMLLLALSLRLQYKTRIDGINYPTLKSYSYAQASKQQSITHNQHTFHSFKKATHSTISPSSQSNNAIIHENTIEPLISILHQAIADKQIYPETAIELHQSGTVKIGFTLTPQGQLKNINLVKSSGYDNFDTAALSAAQAVASVPEASKYLQHDTQFVVDIVFSI